MVVFNPMVLAGKGTQSPPHVFPLSWDIKGTKKWGWNHYRKGSPVGLDCTLTVRAESKYPIQCCALGNRPGKPDPPILLSLYTEHTDYLAESQSQRPPCLLHSRHNSLVTASWQTKKKYNLDSHATKWGFLKTGMQSVMQSMLPCNSIQWPCILCRGLEKQKPHEML